MRPKRHKIGKLEENMSNTWEKAAGLLCLCALLAGMTGCAKKKEPVEVVEVGKDIGVTAKSKSTPASQFAREYSSQMQQSGFNVNPEFE